MWYKNWELPYNRNQSWALRSKFTIGQADKPECLCHFKEESPKHFFLDCFLYTAERQTLFSLVEHYIPKFSSFSKSKQFNILMHGLNSENSEYYYLNTRITIGLQNFILKTKRFKIPNLSHLTTLPLLQFCVLSCVITFIYLYISLILQFIQLYSLANPSSKIDIWRGSLINLFVFLIPSLNLI